MIRLYRTLFAACLVAAPLSGCASYPDLRPTVSELDSKALAVWQKSLEKPDHSEELRKAHLELCLQARKTAKAALGE